MWVKLAHALDVYVVQDRVRVTIEVRVFGVWLWVRVRVRLGSWLGSWL